MASDMLSFTGLPNLHPAVVHFPLALAPVAAVFDVARLTIARQHRWLDPAAKWLWILAAIGAAAARWSGERAAAAVGILDIEAERVLADHADQSLVAMILVVTVAMARVVLSGWEQARERPHVAWGSVLLAVEVAALGALGFTADLGGRLVYQLGVAVVGRPEVDSGAAVNDVATLAAIPAPAAGLPVIDAHGRLNWRPVGPESVGGGIRVESTSGPQALRPTNSGGVLELVLDGAASVVLPGTYGDLRFELEAELERFEGTLALVHHRGEASDRLELTAAAEGAVVELRRGDRSLDRAMVDLGEGPFALVVTSVGRHQRAFLDGVAVAHGHIAELEPGGVALTLEGRGAIRIRRVEIRPAKE
jgi:uncharacterized membrane protein